MYLYMYIKNTGKMANLNGYCLFVLGYYISKESISPIVSLLIEFIHSIKLYRQNLTSFLSRKTNCILTCTVYGNYTVKSCVYD